MLVAILCRFCRCFAGRPREHEPSAKPTGEAVGEARAEAEGQAPGQGAIDDLTAIRGIGIVMQDRLNRVGITNYAKLAEAKPEHVREALGELSRGIKIEAWISQAQELAART